MEHFLRPAQRSDLAALKAVWRSVFGDTDAFINAFFKHYGTETATVVQAGGDIAAAGYLLPHGSLNLPDGRRYRCAMIYSVAVLPAYRGRGLGAELTRALIDIGRGAVYPAIVLHPASDGLFDYYSGCTTLREWFYTSERTLTPPAADKGRLVRLTVIEYARLRGGLLSGIAHIEPDERALSFQRDICTLTGGGLFAILTPGGGDACAIIEAGGTVSVKELLVPDGTDGAEAAIAGTFPADGYAVRTPTVGVNNRNICRFGMLAVCPAYSEPAANHDGAWFGPAFD